MVVDQIKHVSNQILMELNFEKGKSVSFRFISNDSRFSSHFYKENKDCFGKNGISLKLEHGTLLIEGDFIDFNLKRLE